MERITVLTATYNRAHLLPRLYHSLVEQSVKDFVWLIIDDGSMDNTKNLVEGWVVEKKIVIEYYYKENGGLHTAINKAIPLLRTELCVTVDSDDYLAENAIELILNRWERDGSYQYAGILALDRDITSQKVLGDLFPNIESINLIDIFLGKYSFNNADRTVVVRSDLYKQCPSIPEFQGEKFNTPHVLDLEINKGRNMLILNEVVKNVEYQAGGLSNSLYCLYRNNPNGFATTRLYYLSLSNSSFCFKLKQCIHLASCCFLNPKGVRWARKAYSNNSFLMLLAWIPGLLLSIVIRLKSNNSN